MPDGSGHLHFALHKPRGYACSHAGTEGPIVDDLLPAALRSAGVEPVGRLDRDSSGLLLLTTDGLLNHQLRQPGSGVEKEYLVGFRGVLPDDAVGRVAAGLRIMGDPEPTRPAQLVVLSPVRFASASAPERLGQARVVLCEGRRHQVRRMFRALRSRVVTLHRDRIGAFVLPPDLAPGALIEIDAADVVRA